MLSNEQPRQISRFTKMFLAAVVVVTAGCGDGEERSEDASAPEASSAPATTEALTTTTTSTVPTTTTKATDPWDDLPGWASPDLFSPAFEHGRVRVLSFTPELSFVAPDGSGKFCPAANTAWDFTPASQIVPRDADGAGVVPLARLVGFVRGEQTVDATAAAIVADMNIAPELEPIEIDGAAGVRFEGSSADAGDQPLFAITGCTLTLNRQEYWYFWIVDVDGHVVTLSLHTPLDIAEEMLAEAESVIESIDWREI